MTTIDFRGPVTVEDAFALRTASLELHVFLDDEDVTHDCVTADASLNMVVCLDRDINGHVFLDPDDPERVPKRITRLGKVTYALEFL